MESGIRNTVIHLRFKQKKTFSVISKETGVPLSTCKEWAKIYQLEGRLLPNSSPGRPRTVRAKENINKVKEALKEPAKKVSIRKISNNIKQKKSSVHLILKEDLGLKAFKMKKKPKLLPRHKVARKNFALKFLNSSIEKWVFTDEKRFTLNGPPKGNNYVWSNDSRSDEVYYYGNKYGNGSVEVWAAITKFGRPSVFFIERQKNEKFSANDMVEKILKKKVPEIAGIFLENGIEDWIYQQDGDSKHGSRVVCDFLLKETPKLIGAKSWPANSPDLNLIENCWAYLQEKVNAREPQNIAQLKEIINEEWERIPDSYINSLYNSWGNRLITVIENNGGITKY